MPLHRFKLLELQSYGEQLAAHFGSLLDTRELWPAVLDQLSVGHELVGQIVARAPFGVWLGVGQPIPALLEVPSITESDFDYGEYRRGAWGKLGHELAVEVVLLRDETQEVRVRQRPMP